MYKVLIEEKGKYFKFKKIMYYCFYVQTKCFNEKKF